MMDSEEDVAVHNLKSLSIKLNKSQKVVEEALFKTSLVPLCRSQSIFLEHQVIFVVTALRQPVNSMEVLLLKMLRRHLILETEEPHRSR